MNQGKMERRLEVWINLVQQCERECKELNITKDQWIKNNKIDRRVYYKNQKRVRELIERGLSSTNKSEAITDVTEEAKPVSFEIIRNDNNEMWIGAVIEVGNLTITVTNNLSDEVSTMIERIVKNAVQ